MYFYSWRENMKIIKLILLPILLCMQFAPVSEVVRAGGVDELQNLCSKFPLNSRCEGYKAPIPIDTRPGKKAKCLFSGDEKGRVCKVNLTEEQVKLYVETGKRLDILEGEKDTKEVVIPVKTIKSLSYSEKKKIDVGAVFAFGVWGLLAKKKRSTIGIRYQEGVEASEQQVVFVTGRKNGRKIRQQLEQQTNLIADIFNVD